MTIARTRRAFLRLAAALPLLAAAGRGATAAAPASIARLMTQAREHDATLSRRIDVISRAYRGRRYRAHTLVGGPRRPEQFVVRDDVFDCVTFCETVLAAALARDPAGFEDTLRRIRYEHGRVAWAERNHYFAEWIRRAVENGIGVPVEMKPSRTVEKTVNWSNQGRRRVTIAAIPRATLLANRDSLATGDVIGFVSRRASLDFYHTGFVVFGRNGEWLLRHASQSRGRVLDEPMEAFLAANGVAHVALLRPVEPAAVAGRV